MLLEDLHYRTSRHHNIIIIRAALIKYWHENKENKGREILETESHIYNYLIYDSSDTAGPWEKGSITNSSAESTRHTYFTNKK